MSGQRWLGPLFYLSLSVLSFLYGVLAVHLDLWPYTTLVEARIAAEALIESVPEEFLEIDLRKFEFFEDEPNRTGPVVTRVGDQGIAEEELILIDGGLHQYHSLCPNHGCLAWLINRAGMVKHVWEVKHNEVWGDLNKVSGFTSADNIYSVGMHLFANGDLLVSYHGKNTFPYGIGIAKFDKDSKLLWKRDNFSHHWFSVDDHGYIYTPAFRRREIPYRFGNTNLQLSCDKKVFYEDIIAILDPDGNEVASISILDSLVNAGYKGLLFQQIDPEPEAGSKNNLVYDNCNPIHLNDVRVLLAEDAASFPTFEAGDLLVSLRSLNSVAVIGGKTRSIKWLVSGRTVLQHSPRYQGLNRVILFSNHGGPHTQGGSALVSLDIATSEAEMIFPSEGGADDLDFFSYAAGHIGLHPSKKRALVSLSRQGRVVEVDLEERQVLWSYTNTHDMTHLFDKDKLKNKSFGRFSVHAAKYVHSPQFEMNQGKVGDGT